MFTISISEAAKKEIIAQLATTTKKNPIPMLTWAKSEHEGKSTEGWVILNCIRDHIEFMVRNVDGIEIAVNETSFKQTKTKELRVGFDTGKFTYNGQVNGWEHR